MQKYSGRDRLIALFVVMSYKILLFTLLHCLFLEIHADFERRFRVYYISVLQLQQMAFVNLVHKVSVVVCFK